jgi:hypothetical protein
MRILNMRIRLLKQNDLKKYLKKRESTSYVI